MAEERIIITIREDGSRVVSRNIRDIGDSSRNSMGAVDALNKALGVLAGALAIDKLRGWLDTWTSAVGKVNIFTHSIAETNMMMDRLVKLAQDARQPLDATINSFHQMTLAASSLGASQNDLLGVTASVNKVFAIQGTTANTARGGIIQFGQAMTEGIVRAQEYNSMINAMPLLLKVVAQNLEGTGGSVAKLRQMMLKGELTSKKFFQAIKDGGPTIQALFERSGKTIGQGLTVLETAMIQFVGRMDQAVGISRTFFSLAQWGADNIEHLAKALIALSAPLVIQGLLSVGRALQGIALAAIANPYTALAAAIIAATTALALYKDQIILVEEQQISLGDYAKATWDVVKETAADAGTSIADYVRQGIEMASREFLGLEVNWTAVMNTITQTTRNVINIWVGWFVSLPKAFLAAWDVIPGALYNIFVKAFNAVKTLIASSLNAIFGMINPLLEKAGLGQIMAVQFEQTEYKMVAGMQETVGKINDIMMNGISTDWVGKAGDAIDSLTKRAATYADQRRKDAAEQAEQERKIAELMNVGGEGDDFSPTAKKGKTKKGPKGEFDNPRTLENYFRRLLNTIQPLSGAVLEYEKAQRILNAAQKAGLITGEQNVKYLELVKNHYRDIVDPIGAVYREMQRETEQLGLNTDERDVANKMYKITEELRTKGVMLTQIETAAIKEQVVALQEQNRVAAARDAIYQGTTGAMNQIAAQQQALTQAFAQGAITQEYYNYKLRDSNTEWAALKNSLGDGTFATVFTEGIGRALEGFTTLASGVADILTQTVGSAIDGISNSLAGAIVKGENFSETLYNLAITIGTQLLASLIKLGLQYLINSALGSTALATMTGASVAAAGTTAAAWAPAAAAVSLASFGSNSVAAMAGMTAAYGLSSTLSTALPGFKTGGDMMVGGTGGTDSQLVAFMATPNEKVSIRKPGQAGYDGNDEGRESKRTVQNFHFTLPGITNEREARRSTGAISRGVRRALDDTARFQ